MHIMTKTVLPLLLVGISLTATAHDLEITVTGYESMEGTTYLGVYDQVDRYDNNDSPVFLGQAVPQEGKTTFIVEGLVDGDYAVKIFHDENMNAKMDRNLLGIPTEKYAFSNNAKGNFGPASFEDAKVSISADTEITINF